MVDVLFFVKPTLGCPQLACQKCNHTNQSKNVYKAKEPDGFDYQEQDTLARDKSPKLPPGARLDMSHFCCSRPSIDKSSAVNPLVWKKRIGVWGGVTGVT